MAILVTDGFEQVELTEPRKALDEAGATTKIVSPNINAYGRGADAMPIFRGQVAAALMSDEALAPLA